MKQEELAFVPEPLRPITSRWIADMEGLGWSRDRLEVLLPVGVQIFSELLDVLSGSDFLERARPLLRIWRFVADQMNLNLQERTDLFLRLRPYVLEELKKRLAEGSEAEKRVEVVWEHALIRLMAHAQSAVESARQKYEVLFRNSPEACLLVLMDDQGTVVEANEATSRLTGYDSSELIGKSALQLLPEKERPSYLWALRQLKETGFVRVENGLLHRKDGTAIPVEINGLVMTVDGHPFCQCIIRDLSQRVRLEEQFRERMSQEREALLATLERERYQARQTALLAQIAERALTALNEQAVYDVAAEALKEHLGIFDVALFSVNQEKSELILRAHSGAYQHLLEKEYRQPVTLGLVGESSRTGQPVLVNDVTQDPRYYQATENETATRSELVVPIKVQGQVVGVVDLHSDRKDAFGTEELNLARTIADQMALAIEAIRHYERVQMFRELNQQIVESLPDAVALLDEKGRIVAVNETFCWKLCQRAREFVIGSLWQKVLPSELSDAIFKKFNTTLDQFFEMALTENREFFFPEIPYSDIWVDFRVIPVKGASRKRVMFYVRDASLRVRRLYQLQNVVEIGQAMERTTDIHRLLHAILTAATAGPGLGFNRAFLFLYDRTENILKAALAVGPLTAEEAYATWQRLSSERKTLSDFLSASVEMAEVFNSPIMQRIRDVRVPMDDSNLLSEALKNRQLIRINRPFEEPRLPERIRSILTDREVVCVPLVVQDEPIGLILADNPFSGHPITEDSCQLLRVFTASASIAIRNAQLIHDLKASLAREQEMKRKLDLASRLAAIGDMATRIAHDLRNPLVTIGGLARQIQRRVPDVDLVSRNIGMIIDEVSRLERGLKDLMDFAGPKTPSPSPLNLSEVIHDLAEAYRPGAQAARVELVTELEPNPPPVMADRAQLERVFFNLWINAVQAMPEGGRLTVRLWTEGRDVVITVSDTGKGIPPERLEDVFKPFFTTREDGTGLGLAICKNIIDEHGGSLAVESEVGRGTTVIIRLPAFISR